MINALKIPRKLGFSFLLICASAAIVMTVFFTNISMIRTATERNNHHQSVHAQALSLETQLLRQNSQLRGFLVTGDPSYLKSYDEARDEYDSTSIELEKAVEEPGLRAAVAKSRDETLAWRGKWGDRLIARVKGGARDEAAAEFRAAGKAVMVSAAVTPLRDVRDAQIKLIEENSALQDGAISTAMSVLIVGGMVLIGIAVTLALMLSRMIARPITGLTKAMGELAAGQNDIVIPDVDRGDELGDMARAVLIFRDAAIAKKAADEASAQAEAAQKAVVETVSAQLSELA